MPAPHPGPEFWDLLDRDGNPLGRVHERDAGEHPEGTFHLVVAACVYRPDGLVLMSQRSATKSHPLAWEFPAGSALAGEASADAVHREVLEETGVHVAPQRFQLVQRFVEASAFFDFYVAPAPKNTTLTPDPVEVAQSQWVTRAVLERRWHEGVMAGPWTPRLEAMWNPAVAMMDAALAEH